MDLFAGASGFSYAPWKGPFYPADLPARQMLAYYASRLPAVEINNTFYRLPKASVLSGWAEQTPDGFRFALKASRRISHMQRLKDVDELVAHLFAMAEALENKLGPTLVQLPPHMKKNVERLATFLALIPEGRRVAMEFRHASWFEDDVLDLLRRHDAALVVAETEDDEEVPDVTPTAGWGYLRLRRDDYGDADLVAWADRIRAQPWTEVYTFFKHEDEGAAPKMALRLMEMVRPDRPDTR
jgi:uncharacterized protein YecE (DUF72 family)